MSSNPNRMKSIRRELTVKLLTGISLLILVAGLATFSLLKARFTEQFDRVLIGSAQLVISEIDIEGDVVEFDLEEKSLERLDESGNVTYFLVELDDGRTLARSKSLGSYDIPVHRPEDENESVYYDLDLPAGRPGRAVVTAYVPTLEQDPRAEEDDPGPEESGPNKKSLSRSGPVRTFILFARDRQELDQTIRATLLILLGVGFSVPIALAGLVRLVVLRSFRSTEHLAAEIRSVDASDLGHRFEEDHLPAELAPLAKRLNELMRRVELVMRKERRFAADAAHELRTPVAELLTLSEVGLSEAESRPEGTGQSGDFLRDARNIALQMRRIVETLLALARIETESALDFEEVDLAALADQSYRPYEKAASEKGLQCRFKLPKGHRILTDRTVLGAIISNIISNAVKYAPVGSAVQCELGAMEGELLFRVRNAAEGLVEEDLDEMFEPFWRKSASRTSGSHSGLGLSLVAACVKRLGGSVRATLTSSSDFVIEVQLPLRMA